MQPKISVSTPAFFSSCRYSAMMSFVTGLPSLNVTHELKVWRAEGVETGEQADAHLKLLALRQSREEYVSSLRCV